MFKNAWTLCGTHFHIKCEAQKYFHSIVTNSWASRFP